MVPACCTYGRGTIAYLRFATRVRFILRRSGRNARVDAQGRLAASAGSPSASPDAPPVEYVPLPIARGGALRQARDLRVGPFRPLRSSAVTSVFALAARDQQAPGRRPRSC